MYVHDYNDHLIKMYMGLKDMVSTWFQDGTYIYKQKQLDLSPNQYIFNRKKVAIRYFASDVL